MTETFAPIYRTSWALIVGINAYISLPPLSYAVNDARAIYKVLVHNFGFPPDHVFYLEDRDASEKNILSVFDAHLNEQYVQSNDRVLIFFAGHGFTRKGAHGNTGYIAPVDTEQGAWRTLIAMHDFIHQAEFIPAKHILFIMDACYSGLALTRGNGAMNRAIRQMIMRSAVQIITAGKADEVVADGGGGPHGENSVFTGILLQGLEGAAAKNGGPLTAQRLMHYVYEQIIIDPKARQTPHYGWIAGDGDFVFRVSTDSQLPVSVEFALAEGDTNSRLLAINTLTELADGEDSEMAELALDRLQQIAWQETDRRLRLYAAQILGEPPDISDTLSDTPTLSLMVEEPSTHRPLFFQLLLVLLSSLVCILLGIVGFSASQSMQQQDDLVALQTYAAENGALLATLTDDDATQNASPTAISSGNNPGSTSTPIPPPTATLTPTEVQDTQILFLDNFSEDTGEWEIANWDEAARIIEDGHLSITVNEKLSLWVSRPDYIPPENALISVEAAVHGWQPDSSFGLIFRQTDFDNYYYYRIGMEGSFSLAYQENGVWRFLIWPTPLESHLADGEAHQLSVHMEEEVITLILDGQSLAMVSDHTFQSGNIGVAVGTTDRAPARVVFDDFVVQTP